MKNILVKSLLTSLLLTIFSGCADDRISRTFPCRFTLYTIYHNPCMTLTAINSSNYPIKVSVKKNASGLIQIIETDWLGSTETINITSEIETRAYEGGIYIGANNSIIVCQEAYDGKRVAYDGQCPNCINDYSGHNYPLQFTSTTMQVKCNKCKRIYDLNTGAIISGIHDEGDERLMEYAVTYDNINGRLYIGN